MQIKLEEVRKAKSGQTNNLVILLHGVGSNASDLIELVDYLGVNLTTTYISPNAPTPYDMAPVGFQWFSLKDYSQQALYNELVKAAPVLEQYIEKKCTEYSLKHENVVVLGFSQGAMMALHCLPRLNNTVKAMIPIAGALINPNNLSNEIKSTPDTLLIHGEFDQVVPFAALEHSAAALKNHGINVEKFIMKLTGHSINSAALGEIKKFLEAKNLS
jgi:phospholipase/carboxylesterase